MYIHDIVDAASLMAISSTVEPDLVATEMLVFASESSRNKNDNDVTIAIP